MAWELHLLHFTEIKTKGMYINCLYYKNDFVPRSYRKEKKRKTHIKSLGEMGLKAVFSAQTKTLVWNCFKQCLCLSVCQYY